MRIFQQMKKKRISKSKIYDGISGSVAYGEGYCDAIMALDDLLFELMETVIYEPEWDETNKRKPKGKSTRRHK